VLRDTRILAEACGGVVRTVLEQRFENPNDEPLHVTYSLPLPLEAAVVAFTFVLGDRTITSEIDRRDRARERFEDALASGHAAALLEEERSTVFTQEIGNVPPRTEVLARITLDAKLTFAGESGRGVWEARFPTTLAPRYLGAPGRVVDASKVTFDVREHVPFGPRVALSLAVRDRLDAGRSPESPSHPIQCTKDDGAFVVTFGGEGHMPLDRDVVVRWDAAQVTGSGAAHVHVDRDEDAVYALVTLVAPAARETRAVPRDLTVLLDTSGSMGGEPLAQAKRVTLALIASLHEKDTLHLVEFSSSPRAFRSGPTAASPETKRAASAWVASLVASGGTEMRDGIVRALSDVRPGRAAQVVLVTDGLIGFEHEIVSAILRQNVHGARVHTVGVGSAVNRSLLGPAARAGRGIEIVCGLGEDVEPLVARLLARTDAPVVTGLSIVDGRTGAPVALSAKRVPDLHAGAPCLVPIRLLRETAAVRIEGLSADGPFVDEIAIRPDGVERPYVRALFGREAVSDVEMRMAAGELRGEGDAEIERLGLAYAIVTRKTSLVAIDVVRTVDPTLPTRREIVPHALPYGMSAEGVGLRAASGVMPVMARSVAPISAPSQASYAPMPAAGAPMGPPPASGGAPRGERRKESKSEESREAFVAPKKRAAPPAKPSLLERVARAVLGSADEGAGSGADDHDEESSAPPPAPIAIVGRVVRTSEGVLVIEITLSSEVTFGHDARWLVLSTGEARPVRIDAARSTAPGTYGAGTVLRVVLLHGSGRIEPGDVSALEMGGSAPLHVTIG
jgi:Ca-activated chloride channel family protein